MDLNLTRQSLAIQCGTNKHLRQFDRPAALNFDQDILLDDVRHFFLLLFALVHFLLEVSDLPRDGVKAVRIKGAIRDGSNERRVRVFEGLERDAAVNTYATANTT